MRGIVTMVLGLAVLAWSGMTLFVGVSTLPIRLAAERLEAGASPGPGYFEMASRELADGLRLSVCNRDAIRSLASIRLASVDASLKTLDMSATAKALSEARTSLRAGLRCFPQDGNLWLRLAMVEQALLGSKADIQRMMELSVATAPRERWIVTRRLTFALKLSELNVVNVSDVLRRDIETLVRYGQVSDVKDAYMKAGTGSQGIFREFIKTLDAERRQALERALAG